MKEPFRYLENAKDLLKQSGTEADVYIDIKYVQEACETAYLAVLKAIDENLLKKGLTKKELPKSVEAYRKMLQKYLAVHNGKLLREFERIYDELHIAGYYRGLLKGKDTVKDAFNAAKMFIEKIV